MDMKSPPNVSKSPVFKTPESVTKKKKRKPSLDKAESSSESESKSNLSLPLLPVKLNSSEEESPQKKAIKKKRQKFKKEDSDYSSCSEVESKHTNPKVGVIQNLLLSPGKATELDKVKKRIVSDTSDDEKKVVKKKKLKKEHFNLDSSSSDIEATAKIKKKKNGNLVEKDLSNEITISDEVIKKNKPKKKYSDLDSSGSDIDATAKMGKKKNGNLAKEEHSNEITISDILLKESEPSETELNGQKSKKKTKPKFNLQDSLNSFFEAPTAEQNRHAKELEDFLKKSCNLDKSSETEENPQTNSQSGKIGEDSEKQNNDTSGILQLSTDNVKDTKAPKKKRKNSGGEKSSKKLKNTAKESSDEWNTDEERKILQESDEIAAKGPKKELSTKKQKPVSIAKSPRKKLSTEKSPPTKKQKPDSINDKLDDEDYSIHDLVDVDPADLERLNEMTFQVPFEVPQLHRVSIKAGRPTTNERMEIERLQLEVKTGCYTKAEDDIIKKNWLEFCKLHDLETHPGPFLQLRAAQMKGLKKVQVARFMQFLAHGLDNRLLNSVYSRFKRLFILSVANLGPFTISEDKIIMQCRDSGVRNPHALAAQKLNRTRKAVEKRYQFLTSQKPATITSEWTDEMIARLVKRIMKVAKVKDLNELNGKVLPFRDWERVAKKFDFSAADIRIKWIRNFHTRIFCTNPHVVDIKLELLRILKREGFSDWKEIHWHDIAKHFEGYTSLKLYDIFKGMVGAYVVKEKQHDLEKCINTLHSIFIERGVIPRRTRDIKKIEFEEVKD